MRAEWINPFVASTVATFQTLLNCKLTRGTPTLKSCSQPGYEISGLMSLEGKARGLVVVSFERDVAVKATKLVMGRASGMIDADVVDVVCELTNMIAGGANNRLEHLQMRIGLPSVISGKNHIINYPTGVATISIPFESIWGPLSVDASVKEVVSDDASGQQATLAEAHSHS